MPTPFPTAPIVQKSAPQRREITDPRIQAKALSGLGRSCMSELKSSVKPFEISKWEVWQAYEKVKANKGAPGVDGEDLAAFES
jgi:hypothetical protein